MDKLLLFVVLAFAVGSSVNALDLEAELRKEPPFCGSYQVAQNVNTTWIRSTEIWYVPFWTRSELLLGTKTFVSDLEFTKMSEERALNDICFLMNWKSGDMYGFGKKLKGSSELRFNPVRPGAVDWAHNGEYAASSYFLLTDNKSFVVGVDVFADGRRGGYVMIPDPDVDKFSNNQILEWKRKLVEVGFEEGNFLQTPLACAKSLWENQKKANLKEDEDAEREGTTQAAATEV